jgi:hypothetical protein
MKRLQTGTNSENLDWTPESADPDDYSPRAALRKVRRLPERWLPVKAGDSFVFDTLTWNENWEGGNPSMVLSPIFAFSDEHRRDILVEHICLLACCDDVPALSNDDILLYNFPDRGWSLANFKRVFKQVLGGKRFKIRKYIAEQFLVQFLESVDHGPGLTFEVSPVKQNPNPETIGHKVSKGGLIIGGATGVAYSIRFKTGTIEDDNDPASDRSFTYSIKTL